MEGAEGRSLRPVNQLTTILPLFPSNPISRGCRVESIISLEVVAGNRSREIDFRERVKVTTMGYFDYFDWVESVRTSEKGISIVIPTNRPRQIDPLAIRPASMSFIARNFVVARTRPVVQRYAIASSSQLLAGPSSRCYSAKMPESDVAPARKAKHSEF